MTQSRTKPPTKPAAAPPPPAGDRELAAPPRMARGSVKMPVEGASGADFFAYGVDCEREGAHEDAIEAFTRALATPAVEFESRCWLGHCLRARGRFGQAAHELKHALYRRELASEHKTWLYQELGACYEALGDVDEALFYLELAAKGGADAEVDARLARLRGRTTGPT